MTVAEKLTFRMWSRFASLVRSSSGTFLLVTLASNGVFVLRSYIALVFLDYRQLGFMAIVQTLVLLIGTLQFGLLNGGYRILCSADAVTSRKLNDLAYTLIGALTLVVFLFSPMLLAGSVPAGHGWIIATGVCAGSLTLLRTWVNNQLIAADRLPQLNKLTIWSGLISLLPLLFVEAYPLEMSLASFLLQPGLFVVLALVYFPDIRPARLSFDGVLLKQVMQTGVLIFLSGILLQVNAQIERFYVVRYLSVEALGHLYISILFVSLFTIIPNALQSIYVPRIVKQYDFEIHDETGRSMFQITLYSFIYCVLGALILYAFGDLIISFLSKKYSDDLYFVKILYPAISIFTVASSLAIICNITLRYWHYIMAFGIGTLTTVAGFGLAIALAMPLDLAQVTLVKAVAYTASGVALWVGYLRIARQLPQFRVQIRARSRGE